MTANQLYFQHINVPKLLRDVVKLYDWINTDEIIIMGGGQAQAGVPQSQSMDEFIQASRGGGQAR